MEQQAFGRTSRQGQKGTAQLIVNKDAIFKKLNIKKHMDDISISELKSLRDVFEIERLKETSEFGVHKLKLNDHLFNEFCAFFKGLKSEGINKYKLILSI